MSATAAPLEPFRLPKTPFKIVPVSEQNVRDYWQLFVNRRAYTRQSAKPDEETGRHHYYKPTNKETGKALELDPDTLHKHLAGYITVGLYAINPQTQCCKWVAIDADYADAPFALAQLRGELREDGVEAALEMSRRGGHLWVFCQPPLLASQCRIYIYNVALRLGVPIKGVFGERDGIEIFPRQDRLAAGEFGNAIRGPLGIHRVNNHRYWYTQAIPEVGLNLNDQLNYLKNLKKLSEADLLRVSRGMSIPEECETKFPTRMPSRFYGGGKEFRILDYVKPKRKRSKNYWAQCPSCALAGNDRAGDNLAISMEDPRKYKCWAGCTKEEIREALGCPIRTRRF